MSHPPEEWARERFNAACAKTAGSPTFEGVYVGPLWEIPSEIPRGMVQGWKRAVLHRTVGGGAENWGHLFLVVSPGPNDPTVKSLAEGLPRGDIRRIVIEGPMVLEEGLPRVLLYLQANHERYAGSLRAFASHVTSLFRAGGSWQPDSQAKGRPGKEDIIHSRVSPAD